MADGKLTNKHFEEIASRVDVDKMEVIARGKLRINLEIIEAIKANNVGEKQNQEMIKAWAYRTENSQHQVIRLAKLLYEAAKDGHIDAYDVYDVLGVKRDAALAFVDPTPEPVRQQVPSSVNGARATAVAAPSSEPVLTDIMKLNLARQITTPQELRNLATLGLRVKSNVIDTKLTNERDINEAALKVIQQWASSKEDKRAAYLELCEILVKIRRSAYINVLADQAVD